jgi:alanyl-tRNA synthetase
MKFTEIRKIFIDYFVERGHTHVPSAPLIPPGDPSMLFTTAGMVPFKKVFAGLEKRPYKRAITVQKCLRTSDIEEVGNTLRHNTFFFMLGNFSFGDYFKKGAIEYCWDFLTRVLEIDEEKLWVTIYIDDDEAEKIWREVVGFPEDKIVRLVEDNFWGPAGDSGPCGPSSEVYYDLGPDIGCGKKICKPGCDCDRYNEIWNLVFPQYIKDIDGTRTDMPEPGVDTGMGFERLAMVLQKTYDPYRTDMFKDIVSGVEDTLGVSYQKNTRSIRIIADHIRALTFAIGEGIMPGKTGRGYILRRLIRRAFLQGWYFDRREPFLTELVSKVVDIYGKQYENLMDTRELTESIIKKEEESFVSTLTEGYERLEDLVERTKESGGKIISGDEIFTLYDTYGFPYDISEEIVNRYNLQIDRDGFDRALAKQKERSKEGADFSGDIETIDLDELLSVFKGYDLYELKTRVKEIVKDGEVVNELKKGEEAKVLLDETHFYAEAGGQVSDEGFIEFDGGLFIVERVYIDKEGRYVHRGELEEGVLSEGQEVRAKVDVERRRSIMRNHTVTHLLHRALREVLGEVVKQAGSLVAPERLRFDYTYHKRLTDHEIDEIEEIVNDYILLNLPVVAKITSYEEAVNEGAIALFTEKYGDKVRTVSIEGVSIELCGGTHCKRTGDIGSFYIKSEEAVSAGMRRIEAITGLEAYRYAREQRETLEEVSEKVGVPVVDVEKGIEKLLDEKKELEKEVERQKALRISEKMTIGDKTSAITKIGNIITDIKKVESLGVDVIGVLIDKFKKEHSDKPALILLAEISEGKVLFVCGTTDKAIDLGVKAGDVVKVASEVCGGGGGGRPDFAQAGGKKPEKLEEAFEAVREYIRAELE